MVQKIKEQKLTRKDFVSDQEVRWCPGCGDYAILAQMQKILPNIGVDKENIVFVSGIGCSSRFPHYMNTYGMHTIHGRAPTFATGLKVSNPDLSVWVITGDGDGLSIGGNHLLHCLRRNVDVKIILFNNRIYGLTKGQYSPTSLPGHRTKSSPLGSIDFPLNPLSIALASEATFVARTQDTNIKHLSEILLRAAAHKGCCFVEIFQNCVVYNPTAWDHTTQADVRDDNILFLEDGQPLVFGKDSQNVVHLDGLEPKIRPRDKIKESDILIHHEGIESVNYANMLSRFSYPEMPLPFGVLRSVSKPTYNELLKEQIESDIQSSGAGDLDELYSSGDTWTVE
ncbi:MAG: 2-oxoacid:ferredoxin oxidoreductase subunit beta [Candidatus Latescibacterota bacterium]|nr:2-oxoacid:ferredoxin oxidoreductase subunit beta [Candidatus Latescibacterota bacterium]